MSLVIKIYSMVALTVRESVARKTFITFFAISTLIHLFFLFVLDVDMLDGTMALVKLGGQEISGNQGFNLTDMIVKIQGMIAFSVFSGGLILSVFTTAGLIPSMLEKGNVELLLSKPLSRWQLFLCRFLGATLIMAFNVAYFVIGVWLILGIQTGIWYLPAFYIIPMVIITFALVFASMSLVGVLSRSPGVTIMVTFLVLFLSLILQHHDKIYGLLSSSFYYYLIAGTYHALPKTSELVQITQALVAGQPVGNWAPLWSSCIAGGITLLAALGVFYKKDY